MEQEKELLHSQTSWLNEELKAKSEELLSLSRQKGNQILELKCKLENKEEEVCIYKMREKKLFCPCLNNVIVPLLLFYSLIIYFSALVQVFLNILKDILLLPEFL